MILQLTAVLENRPGRLADILKTLADSNIDLNGISIADSVDYGLCRLIVSDPEKGMKALTDNGFIMKSSTVLPIEIPDIPGSLEKTFQLLSDHGINIQYVYAFGSKLSEHAMIIVKTDADPKAKELLEKAGIKVLDKDQLQRRLKA